MATDYRRMGAKARATGEARESCRFRAEGIRAEWLAGWDEQDRERAEAQRRHAEAAARLRWEDHTSYSQGERGRVEPRYWVLMSSRLEGLTLELSAFQHAERKGWLVRVGMHRTITRTRELDWMGVELAKATAEAELRDYIAQLTAKLEDALAVLDAATRT